MAHLFRHVLFFRSRGVVLRDAEGPSVSLGLELCFVSAFSASPTALLQPDVTALSPGAGVVLYNGIMPHATCCWGRG